MVFEFFGGADQSGNVVADHLGDDGAAGVVFGDGTEDGFFEIGSGVDAEVFGVKKIRPAVTRHEAHEGQIGHILHRREGQERVRFCEQTVKRFSQKGLF